MLPEKSKQYKKKCSNESPGNVVDSGHLQAARSEPSHHDCLMSLRDTPAARDVQHLIGPVSTRRESIWLELRELFLSQKAVFATEISAHVTR